MNKLSIDVGFGHTKYATKIKNRVSFNKFVSGICKVPESNLENVAGDNKEYLIFNNEKYLIGDLSSKLMINPLNMTDYEEYKLCTAIIFNYIVKKLRITESVSIEYVLGITPALWDKKEDLKKYISENSSVNIGNIEILPQGISCHNSYRMVGLDLKKDMELTMSDIISTNYVGVDIGYNTLDFYICLNNTITDYGVKGIMKKGLCVVTENIIKKLKKERSLVISDLDAKLCLDNSYYERRKQVVDLSQMIDILILDYIGSTIDLIEKEYGEQINRLDNIVIFGGGAGIIKKYIDKSETLSSKIKELYPDNFLLLPKNNPEYYNVVGYLLKE